MKRLFFIENNNALCYNNNITCDNKSTRIQKGDLPMKKSTKKIIIWILVLALITPVLVWSGALAKNLALTVMHKDKIENMQFTESEELLPEFDWYRVTSYSDEKIEVYFVNTQGKGTDEEYKIGVNMIFRKTSDGWDHTDMEQSILWSGAGSADNYIWPYWYHVFWA